MSSVRSVLSNVLELVGFAVIAVGLGSIWSPLGIIAAGVALLVIGYGLG